MSYNLDLAILMHEGALDMDVGPVSIEFVIEYLKKYDGFKHRVIELDAFKIYFAIASGEMIELFGRYYYRGIEFKIKKMNYFDHDIIDKRLDDIAFPGDYKKKRGMYFKAKNGKVYQLTKDEYFSENKKKWIYQTIQGWFYLENIAMWCYQVGEGSIVKTLRGEVVEILCIFPNGTVEGGRSVACSNNQSYREYDLEIIEI